MLVRGNSHFKTFAANRQKQLDTDNAKRHAMPISKTLARCSLDKLRHVQTLLLRSGSGQAGLADSTEVVRWCGRLLAAVMAMWGMACVWRP